MFCKFVPLMEQALTKGDSVPAVNRAVAILEVLANSRRGLNLSEVGRKVGLPKSSTYRLLATLESMDCVEKNTDTRRYHLGPKLVVLGRAAFANLGLRDSVRPFLMALQRQTGLTVHLSVMETDQGMIIDRIDGGNTPPVASWIGRAIDIHCTAAGKSLVAFLPREQMERHIKAGSFVRHNHKTIVTVGKLRENLAKVRELGYAMDDEEEEIGMRCIGAPVFDNSGYVVAAVSAVGTTEQVPTERVPAIGETIKQFATAISTHLASQPLFKNRL
jgi:DNA-binding IclR family transcriptional regulator